MSTKFDDFNRGDKEPNDNKVKLFGTIGFVLSAILVIIGIIIETETVSIVFYSLGGIGLLINGFIMLIVIKDLISDNKNSVASASQSSREERWRKQAEQDKLVLESGDPRAIGIKNAIASINALWEATCESKDTKYVSELYLEALTAELFLENYSNFQAGQHDDIKDKLYTERPYLVLETLINMGLYIFQTGNNVHILEYIVNSSNNQFLSSKPLARSILAKERQLNQ